MRIDKKKKYIRRLTRANLSRIRVSISFTREYKRTNRDGVIASVLSDHKLKIKQDKNYYTPTGCNKYYNDVEWEISNVSKRVVVTERRCIVKKTVCRVQLTM